MSSRTKLLMVIWMTYENFQNLKVQSSSLGFDAQHYDSICGKALVEKGLGSPDSAFNLLSEAIFWGPNVSVAWIEVGLLFGTAGNVYLAGKCFKAAERLFPDDRLPKEFLRELHMRGRLDAVSTTISLDGDGPTVSAVAVEHQRKYKRKLYERYYELDTANRRLRQAIAESPLNVDFLQHAAAVSVELLDHKGAIRLLNEALALRPDDGSLFIKLVEAQSKGCIFDDYTANIARLSTIVLSQLRAGATPALSPIQSTMLPVSVAVSLGVCSHLGRAHHAAALRASRRPLPPPPPPPRRGPLRLAYLSSHFTSSSIGREMLFLVAAHHPAAATPRCYALNPDTGSWLQHTWRAAIAAACG